MAAPNALHDRIDRDFSTHPIATPQVGILMDDFRAAFKRLAHDVADETPECREQSLAVTKLEEALFYTIAAIARNQDA